MDCFSQRYLFPLFVLFLSSPFIFHLDDIMVGGTDGADLGMGPPEAIISGGQVECFVCFVPVSLEWSWPI